MARRIPSLRRSLARVPPKKKFILFCEGRNTEPDYFKAMRGLTRGALIEILPEGGVGVPRTIADRAVAEARRRARLRRRGNTESFESRDEIWAVFDRDEHPHYEEAVDFCSQHGVFVARSNPCFEL